ncbi:DNA repair and recombination protein [Babesia ovis]|uniref:DNA repair and recombination protein n=1 Tax=Babesia ovis TaxID=5869 RepID=A0A9W5TAL3_BABOV|nr:DNA repair and recombination protein [Babesia ovis]
MSLSTSCIRDIDEIWFTAETAAPFGHLQFGIPVIDDALGGGVFSGRLTEIYGAAGSGKTQLALSLVAQLRLLVVDSIASIFRPYMHIKGWVNSGVTHLIVSVAGNNVNNILSVASLLKRLAHQMDVAILVINEVML